METKRLYRSRSERIIGGVCGGLAEYINIDSTVMRLVFVALALLGGHGLLIYLIMLLIVPEEPSASEGPMVPKESAPPKEPSPPATPKKK